MKAILISLGELLIFLAFQNGIRRIETDITFADGCMLIPQYIVNHLLRPSLRGGLAEYRVAFTLFVNSKDLYDYFYEKQNR